MAALAAATTYTCMYAFRKPFTAATFDGLAYLGISYKVWLVTAQALGYMASKFFGIRYISELKSSGRFQSIVGLIGIAWLSLLGFALVPAPWNIFFLFLNGLPLGLIWGIVFSYLEGRRTTEVLGVTLAATFIFASGFVKSVGTWVMIDGLPQLGGQNHFWMPFVTGALFIAPLVGAAWLLDRTPPPDQFGRAARSERKPMTGDERRAFLQNFLLGIAVLVAAYLLLTVLRDLRDNFAAEMWIELGYGGQSSIYTQTELPATVVILASMSLLVFVKDNNKALFINHLSILLGMVLVFASTVLFSQQVISAPSWAMFNGVGVRTGDGHWHEADQIFICSGQDFDTLYPQVFAESGITRCKLQMMRTPAQPARIGASPCAGLALTHYKAFEKLPSLPALRRRFEAEMPTYLRWGIHVLVSQNQVGKVTLGDTHEYCLHYDPFDRTELNDLIVKYLETFCRLPKPQIMETWHGIYPKLTDGRAWLVGKPEPGVTILNGLGGAGMTLSFGIAERVVSQ